MRLALALGKTKAELLRDIGGARELGEWLAYFDLEPPGVDSDRRFAALQATICNASGNYKKRIKQKDFLPKRKRLFKSVTDTIKDQIAAMKAATGG